MATGKRSNNTLVIVVGLLTVVVGTVLAALVLLSDDDGNDGAAGGGDANVPVLVARRDIPKGASGSQLSDAVEVQEVPVGTRASDALTSIEQLVDRTALADIPAQSQIRSGLLRTRTVRAGAITIPPGRQAVAITVDFTPAGAGYIGPGDKVNVYALFDRAGETVVIPGKPAPPGPQLAADRLVLAGLEVLDVSQEVAPSTATTAPAGAASTARPAGATITYLLAVDANQAERLIFFTTYTRLYLTLVPRDQPDSSTPGRDQGNVLRG